MAEASQEDVIALLTEDHHRVRRLLRELHDAQGKEAQRLLETLQEEVRVHAKVEEEIVYPAYRDAIGGESAVVQVEESLSEHDVAFRLLDDVLDSDAGTPQFQGRLAVLKESIEHHADEEEDEMFPRLRKSLGKDRLVRLGQEVRQRKRSLQSHGGGQPAEKQRATKAELYEEAKRLGIEGRGAMDKDELADAVRKG